MFTKGYRAETNTILEKLQRIYDEHAGPMRKLGDAAKKERTKSALYVNSPRRIEAKTSDKAAINDYTFDVITSTVSNEVTIQRVFGDKANKYVEIILMPDTGRLDVSLVVDEGQLSLRREDIFAMTLGDPDYKTADTSSVEVQEAQAVWRELTTKLTLWEQSSTPPLNQ